MSKNVVAWKVTEDAEGYGCIVFHSHGIAARRLGADELGSEFAYVECRREKQFDEYASLGRVPPMALIEAGWWLECTQCSQRISEDCEETPLEKVVVSGDRVYCDQSCKDEHDSEIDQRNAAFEKFKAALTAQRPDLTYSEFTGGYPWVTCFAKFMFPGAKYGGSVRDQDGDGNLQWFVAQGDQAAWENYNGVKA